MSNVIFGNNSVQTIYGLPTNITFCGIWEKAADFVADYKASGIYSKESNRISDNDATLLYYLLYSRYGNSSIASRDANRFKYNVYDIIFQYGPTWVKRLELQYKIRNLTDTDLVNGGKAIYNHAYNPGTEPGTSSLTELTAINEQNTTNYSKSKLEGYTLQWQMLDADVSEEFLGRFKKLFVQVTSPLYQLGFPVEED